MELILIRGKKNGGKTTTAALVNNYLKKDCKALERLFWLDKGLAPVNGDNGETHDFHSVLTLANKTIVIISAGDDAPYLREEMNKMKSDYQPDIMIVCARFRSDNHTMKMIQSDFKEEYSHCKQVILRYDKSLERERLLETKRIKAKEVIEHIKQICIL